MGTRAVVYVFESDTARTASIAMYIQSDGYISGVGKELADILEDRVIVNGYGYNTPEKASNGMSCLAATIVASFKDDIGGCYLYPPSPRMTQEFNYYIYPNRIRVTNYRSRKAIFDGTWNEFAVFANETND